MTVRDMEQEGDHAEIPSMIFLLLPVCGPAGGVMVILTPWLAGMSGRRARHRIQSPFSKELHP